MKIKLYQIAPEKDDKNLMFMGFEFTVLHGGINADSYELVFDGDLPAQTAEDVFAFSTWNIRTDTEAAL